MLSRALARVRSHTVLLGESRTRAEARDYIADPNAPEKSRESRLPPLVVLKLYIGNNRLVGDPCEAIAEYHAVGAALLRKLNFELACGDAATAICGVKFKPVLPVQILVLFEDKDLDIIVPAACRKISFDRRILHCEGYSNCEGLVFPRLYDKRATEDVLPCVLNPWSRRDADRICLYRFLISSASTRCKDSTRMAKRPRW